MTAIAKNKSEPRGREWWLCALLKVVVGWPLPEAALWTGPEAGVGARLLEFGSNRALRRGKDRCKFRCKDAYLWQHLFHCSPSPAPTKAVSKAMLSWMTEMPCARSAGVVWSNGAGTAAGRGEGGVTSTFYCSLLSRLSSFKRADVALALSLL